MFILLPVRIFMYALVIVTTERYPGPAVIIIMSGNEIDLKCACMKTLMKVTVQVLFGQEVKLVTV